MSNCNCHTSANSDGSGRLQRYLTALDPAYAKIDGRSTEELLVFIKRYAAQIRFYDIPESTGDNTPDDISLLSWREFFRRDLAVTAASIMLIDTAAFKTEYDENRAELEMTPTPHHFGNLFDPILGMAAKLDGWLSLAIPGNPLYEDLRRIIQSGLKPAMKKILAFEEAFRLIDAKHPLRLDYTPIENDDLWGLNEEIIPDVTIYTGTGIEEKMLSAMLYVDDLFNTFYGILNELVDDADKYMQYAMEKYPAHQPHMTLFLSFLQLFAAAQEQMNGITGRMLNFYYRDVLHLEEKPSIPDRVHIIFELAKDIFQYDIAKATSLNGGKDKSGKDQVYITNTDLVVNQAKVKELKTIFIQKGEVEVVTQVNGVATRTMVPSIDTIYARPDAKSADGFGAKITDPGGKWYTFGQGTPLKADKLDIKNPCTFIEQAKALASRKDQAQVGFAIASPQLLLQGGKRIIKLQLGNLANLLSNVKADTGNLKSPFQIYLTGEKEWLDAGALMTKARYDELNEGLDIGLINPFVNIDDASHYIDLQGGFIFIYLPIAAGPVIKFDPKLHTGYAIQTSQPVLRMMLREGVVVNEDVYQKIEFSTISINVQVGSIMLENDESESGQDFKQKIIQKTGSDDFEKLLYFDGLRTLVLHNDEIAFPGDQPFDPFTAFPFPGKSLYIGSEEIFNKPLGQAGGELGINIFKTADKANIFDTWYQLENTDGTQSTEDPNKYAAALLQRRSWQQLSLKFAKASSFTQKELNDNILFRFPPVEGKLIPVTHPRLPLSGAITKWSGQSDKGFIRLTNLRPVAASNFGTAASSQNMAASMQIKEISVSYRSQLTALEANTDQFFHIYPFGAVETYINTPGELQSSGLKSSVAIKGRPLLTQQDKFSIADKAKGNLLVQAYNKLLPQFTFKGTYDDYKAAADTMHLAGTGRSSAFDYESIIAAGAGFKALQPGNNQYSGVLQEQGMLFIGIEKLSPLQSVSLLFQFADGSAEDEDQDPPVIRWSYLTNNEWRPMNGENPVSDTTYGFQTTGIVKLDVPEDATTNNTIISSGLIWFMASVNKDSNRIPMLVDVVTQAVEATFVDNNNDQTHFDQALPAGTIKKLSVKVAEVSKVTQPFASFDGKHKETGKEYYMRVSERLRHKGRAINAWDYEHLVLDRFPSIYKVKAINHTDPECLCRNAVKTGKPARPATATTMEVKQSFLLKYSVDLNPDAATVAALKTAVDLLNNNPTFGVSLSLLGNKTDPNAQQAFDKLGARIREDWKKMGGGGLSYGLESGTFGEAQLSILVPVEKAAVSAPSAVLGTFPLQFDETDSHKAENDAAIKGVLDLLNNTSGSKALIEMFVSEASTEEEKTSSLRSANSIKKVFVALGIGAKRIATKTSTGIFKNGLITIETGPSPAEGGRTALIDSFEVDYKTDLTFETASGRELKDQIGKLKGNIVDSANKAKATVLIQAKYITEAEKGIAESVTQILEKEFFMAGVERSDIKSDLPVIGPSRKVLIQIFLEEVAVTSGGSSNVCCGPQIAPGHVLIVPIADLKNRNGVNRLQPKTGRRTLLEIEAYLKKRTSPFVKVHAKNPVYEQIMVAFRVKFYTGTDKGFYLKKLNEEIVQFLTPWAFDEAKDVKFGAEVYSSSIINFIEERPYVDFITDFFMFVCRDECCPSKEEDDNKDNGTKATVAEILSSFSNCKDFEELVQSETDGLVVARPSTSRSILVSVPQHIIIPYTEPDTISDCERIKAKKGKRRSIGDHPSGDIINAGISTGSAVEAVAAPAPFMDSFDELTDDASKIAAAKIAKKKAAVVKKAVKPLKKKK